MPLSDVLYQDAAQERIQRALHFGRLPHAYLFAGPSGVGKEMLASRLAAVLLCEQPKEVRAAGGADAKVTAWRDACGRCNDCQLLAAGNHPDFRRIYRTLIKMHPDKRLRERKATELGVDVIRHFLIGPMGLHPSRGRAKVFVVCEAERLNPEAQNAMLKTLEEPPEHSYLILLATSADVLLPTTRSRCHLVPFLRLPTEFIVERVVQECGVTADAARCVAELSQGSLGQAIQAARMGLHELTPSIVETVMQAATDPLACGKALLETARGLTSSFEQGGLEADEESADINAARAAQLTVLAIMAMILRDVHRLRAGMPPAATEANLIKRLAAGGRPEQVRRALQSLASAEYQIRRSANTQLIFDTVGIAVGQTFAST